MQCSFRRRMLQSTELVGGFAVIIAIVLIVLTSAVSKALAHWWMSQAETEEVSP